MNCQEFISVAMELACGQLLEPTAQAEANRHAHACLPCAARLASEAALTAALRATRAQMSGGGAGPHVESALLTAFRAQVSARPAETSGAAARLIPQGARSWAAVVCACAQSVRSSRRMRWATALAASIIFAFVAARLALMPRGPAQPHASMSAVYKGLQPLTEAESQKQVQVRPSDQVSGGVALRPGVPRPAIAAGHTPRRNARPQPAWEGEAIPFTFEVDGGRVVGSSLESGVSAAAPQTVAGPADTTSDFVPLIGRGAEPPLESGQMVRVQLPRSALAAVGLPFNAERAGETVQADVLLAHDGTARAIRLLPDRAQVAYLR